LTKYFFGRDTTSGLDGEAHLTRKAQVMANFTPDHLARYTAIWARTLDKYLLRWTATSSTGSPLALRDELFNLHTEFAMAYILGIFDPTHEAVDQRRREIVHMIESFGAVPHLKLVPGSRINKVNKARRSLESWALELVREQRQGLRKEGTILAAVATTKDEHGELIPEQVAAAEVLNHIRPTVIAAYLTTWMLAAFHDHPHVLDRLRADVDGLLREMPAEDNYYANKEWLDRLAYGEAIANEVRRFYPCVPLMMARVKQTFEYNGLIFPQGWSVILGIHGVHRDPRVYSEPGTAPPAHDTTRHDTTRHTARD
jgi:fatty-acid peroxygenase